MRKFAKMVKRMNYLVLLLVFFERDRFDRVEDGFFFREGLEGTGEPELLLSSSSSRGEGIRLSRIFGRGLTSISTSSFGSSGFSLSSKLSLLGTVVGFAFNRFPSFVTSYEDLRELFAPGRSTGIGSGESLPDRSISAKETKPDSFAGFFFCREGDAGLSVFFSSTVGFVLNRGRGGLEFFDRVSSAMLSTTLRKPLNKPWLSPPYLSCSSSTTNKNALCTAAWFDISVPRKGGRNREREHLAFVAHGSTALT